MQLPHELPFAGAGQLGQPSPFEELSQRLAADSERLERMARLAEPFGGLLARELEQADQINREIANGAAARQTEAVERTVRVEQEAMRRIVRDAQSLGERMALQVQQAQAAAALYSSQLVDAIQHETQLAGLMMAAIPNVIETTMREFQRTFDLSHLTNQITAQVQLVVPDLITQLESVSSGIVGTLQQQSAEFGSWASELAKLSVELPADEPKNYRISVETANYAFHGNDINLSTAATISSAVIFQNMSDEEILAALDGEVSAKTAWFGICELMTRRIERALKPHWTETGEFWLVVASFLLALWLAFHSHQP